MKKASLAAGKYGTPPFSVGYMKTPPVVLLGGVIANMANCDAHIIH